jgi:hypothetical protein
VTAGYRYSVGGKSRNHHKTRCSPFGTAIEYVIELDSVAGA